MGLIDSVNRQNRELEEMKKQKIIDSIENYKKQKERQKLREANENLKEYKNDLEYYTKTEINKFLYKNGSNYGIEFYNISRKYSILQDYLKTIIIIKNGVPTVPFKNELELHFDNKYYSILKKCINEQKLHEEYLKTQQKETEETEEAEEIKKRFDWFGFLKTIFFIIIGFIFLPSLLLLFIIIGALKCTK